MAVLRVVRQPGLRRSGPVWRVAMACSATARTFACARLTAFLTSGELAAATAVGDADGGAATRVRLRPARDACGGQRVEDAVGAGRRDVVPRTGPAPAPPADGGGEDRPVHPVLFRLAAVVAPVGGGPVEGPAGAVHEDVRLGRGHRLPRGGRD